MDLVVPHTATVVPGPIRMLRGFVAGVRAALEGAAMVDGLSRTRALLTIAFPLPGSIVFLLFRGWMSSELAGGAVMG